MTLVYLLAAVVVVWLVYRSFSGSKTRRGQSQTEKYEIPITIKVTHESGATDHHYTANIDKDEWEGSFWEVQQPVPVKARLRLNYVDGAGKRTERTVEVRQFGDFGSSTLLIGHCQLRNATRTFRTDRIAKCVDEDSGEIVSDVSTYLKNRYEESPERTRDRLLDDEYDTLRTLLYVGKADGQLRAAEKSIVRETCVAISKDLRMTDAIIEDLFASMAVPTLQAFKLAVGRLAKRDANSRAIVLAAAEKMVATQKTVHPAEQEALDYMRKRFADPDSPPA